MIRVKLQMLQVLIAIDQLLSTVIGLVLLLAVNRIHYADETFSALCYRMREKNTLWLKSYHFINLLFFLQEDHCKGAYMSEVERRQLPGEYR